jgi:hypothetical protein
MFRPKRNPGMQPGTKSCLRTFTEALTPTKYGLGKDPTLRPKRNVSRGCKIGLWPATERCQICGLNDGNGLILASGLSESG